MKRIIMFSFALVMMLGGLSCNAQDKKQSSQKAVSAKVEVYYFHFTRRCMTCQAVESESKKAVESLYPEQVKKGAVTFTALNLDEETSKAVAEKCKASGQNLLIICGNTRVDLTDKGFMYARSNPDKLKEEIKKVIDPLLANK
jgi:hypothetical protein